MATMMMPPATQVSQMRVIQGGQQESRQAMVGPAVGVEGSPMGPGFQAQMGGFIPNSPVPPAQWGPGQPSGGGGAVHPGMGTVEWETLVQQIVGAGGTYGAQQTVINACCAGGGRGGGGGPRGGPPRPPPPPGAPPPPQPGSSSSSLRQQTS